MISKIADRHLSREACIYIRQSTMGQVRFNQESTERQYNLASKAQSLGWSSERIRILDRDLGQSGARTTNREDFKTLVSDVAMSQVGAIFSPRRNIQRQLSSREIRRQHVGGLLLDRPRSHNSTEEKARPAIRHHAHRRDRSQTAGLGCKLSSSCLIIPKPKLNKVHYAAHIGIPNGRMPPSAFGISTRRTGGGK